MAPPLPFLVRNPSFRCVQVAPERVKGRDLARVTFTCTPKDKFRLKGGWLLLDPGMNWVIRDSEVELVHADKGEGVEKWMTHHDFREGANGHPILTQGVVRGEVWEKGRLVDASENTGKCDYAERPDIPDAEFTLSAFGLPEPHWARPPRKTPWFLWAAVAGLACAAVALLIRWARRRAAG